MTHNQYNQRLLPQPSQDQYQGQPRPSVRSNGGGPYYENGYQQPEEGYRDLFYSHRTGKQYDQHIGPAQGREDAYNQDRQGYSRPEAQYYDQQQHSQQYQYDTRYRSHGQASNGQAQRKQDRKDYQGIDEQRPPPVDLKAKSKCMQISV